MLNLKQLSWKAIVVVVVLALFSLATLGLSIGLVVKMLEQWQLVVSLLVVGGATVGLWIGLIRYYQKLKAGQTR